MTHGKTYNKSPRRINHKATRSNTNTGTTALERSVEQTTGGGGGGGGGGVKALLQLANFKIPGSSVDVFSFVRTSVDSYVTFVFVIVCFSSVLLLVLQELCFAIVVFPAFFFSLGIVSLSSFLLLVHQEICIS